MAPKEVGQPSIHCLVHKLSIYQMTGYGGILVFNVANVMILKLKLHQEKL